MAEFQWWLLLVGLVAGGGLVAVVFLDGARHEQDIDEAELPAEANWIATRLSSSERELKARDVEAVLRQHREYRLLPPPDRFEPIDAAPDPALLAAARIEARAEARQRAAAAAAAAAASGRSEPASAAPGSDAATESVADAPTSDA